MYWSWHNKLFTHAKIRPFIEYSRLTATASGHCSINFLRLCVTFWKLTCSHAVTPCWLGNAKECIQSGWSEQRDRCSWQTKSWPWMLVTSKAAVLKNYLAVSTWILNGSSFECHKKKHQPFSLSCVQFGSQAIQISGWKSAWHWRSLFSKLSGS